MPSTKVRGNFSLLKARGQRAGEATLRVEMHGDTVRVEIDYDAGEVVCSIDDFEITNECLNELQTVVSNRLDDFSKSVQAELSELREKLSGAAERVISIVKYHVRHSDISELLFSIRSYQWFNGDDWKGLPESLTSVVRVRSFMPLDSRTASLIQAQLDSKYEPLLCMRHLHRAASERIPHHCWIDATVAAELGIKEILARKEPVLAPLLWRMPSPPLDKLYGALMEEYLGEKSPYLSALRDGASLRNKLVHNPSKVKISHEKAINYVGKVDAALLHAIRLLYPKDILFQEAEARVGHL